MVRTWVRALSAALATAAVVGAGQLGLAYGLGVLQWSAPFDAGQENEWSSHLTWVAFIAAVAVVGGAVAGARSLRRSGGADGFGAWLAVSLAALVGGAAVVPLVALPADAAVLTFAGDPALNASLAAGLGTAVGFFAALAVLCARPVAGSVFVSITWVWLVAVGTAFASMRDRDLPPRRRLGVLDLETLVFGLRQDLVPWLMIGFAVLAGAVIAVYARWLGESTIAVGISGMAGPALIASSYLIAGPGVSGDQLVPWRAALLAVAAGALASLLVAVIRRRRPTSAPALPTGHEPDLATPALEPSGGASTAPTPRTGPVRAYEQEYVSWVSALGTEGAPTEELPARKSSRRSGDTAGTREPDDPTEQISHAGDASTRATSASETGPRATGLGRPYVARGRSKVNRSK